MPPTTTKPRRKSASGEPVPIEALGRLAPQALDLEAAVLGACLIEKDAFGLAANILKPPHFYDPKHQTIFAAMQSLAAKNLPVDLLTTREELKSQGKLDEAGGEAYLAELSQRMVSSAHIEYHARIVAQKALARALITYTSEIQKLAFEEGQDVDDLMQVAEGKLFELSKDNLKKDFTQIDPVIEESMALLHKAASREGNLSGLSCGFDALDNITSGWQNSDLIIIAARPAMGKTAFVLSMIRNIAIRQRVPTAMFSLEMANVQLVNRLIVDVCQIPGTKLKSGQLADHEWKQLDLKLKDLYNAPLYIDDTPSLSVFELRTKARRLVREHDVKVIFIDYLQLMNATGMYYNSRQEEVSTISRSLKGLAKELNIPIIALSQLNRAVETRIGSDKNSPDSKRPQLSDLRESGAIEQDADMVCFIHRPEYYKIYKDELGNDLHGVAEIIVAKHRNGGIGDVRLRFESEYARFANIDNSPIGGPFAAEPEQIVRSSRYNDVAPLPADDDPLNNPF